MLERIWTQYKKMSKPVKASIWFMVCNLLLKGISLISVPIFARLMSDQQYGILSLYMSYQQVILILSTWEISLSAYQKGIFKYHDTLNFFTVSAQFLTNLITVVFFTFIFIFQKYFILLTGMSHKEIYLLFVYMLLYPAYSSWLVLMRTEYKYQNAVAVTLLYSLLNVIIPLTSIVLIDNTAAVKFDATLISSIVIFVFLYVPNMNYLQLLKNTNLMLQQWKYILKYQAPIVVHALSYIVLAQADRIMIGAMVGEAEAAYYSVAYSLGSSLSIFQTSVNQALLPWSYEKLELKQYNEIRKVTKSLLVGMCVIIILFVLVAPEIIKMLFAESYYEAIWSIPPIAVSIYFMFLYSLFVCVENYYEYTRYVAYVSISCGFINIILNGILIRIWGYVVCGYTTAVSYILFCFGHFFFMKRVCRKEGINMEIYDIKTMIGISFMLIGITLVVMLLYPYAGVRYTLFLCSVVSAYGKREQLKELIKKFKKGKKENI